MKDGIFGVPSFVAAGELFFGQDRLDWLRRKLHQMGLARSEHVRPCTCFCHAAKL